MIIPIFNILEQTRAFEIGVVMKKFKIFTIVVVGFSVFLQFSGPQAASNHQPYAGQQDRSNKALSAKDIDDYKNGKGMGFAKSAELNHYPGPLLLRQMAAVIQLTSGQLAGIRAIEQAMKAAATALGRKVLEHEHALDALFAEGSATPLTVRRLSWEIGCLRGELRSVHLEAHVLVRPLLTQHQVVTYDRLRGYGKAGGGHSRHGQH